MPDRLIPKRWRTALRITRATWYLAVIGMGLVGLLFTPRTIAGTIGEPMVLWGASLAAIGGTAMLYGVTRDAYRIEWIAAWPAAGGALMYAGAVWIIAGGGETTRMMQACAVTALTCALIYRGIELTAHAAKLRAEHTGLIR